MESEQFKNFPQFLLIHKHQGTQRRAQVHNHLLSFSYPKANQVREAQLIHWFSIWYETLMVQKLQPSWTNFITLKLLIIIITAMEVGQPLVETKIMIDLSASKRRWCINCIMKLFISPFFIIDKQKKMLDSFQNPVSNHLMEK